MNYLKHYKRLVERAKCRTLEGYFEKHHIVPRCMGGTDYLSNIVRLTPEEHFVAHQLLVKIYPYIPQLVMATRYMCYGNIKNGERKGNKLFGWIRRRHAEAMREINTGRIQSVETIQKRADTLRGRVNGPLSTESIEKRTATRALRGSGKHRSPRSAETKKKLSEANKGKVLTEDHKKNVSIGLKNRPPITCPHCKLSSINASNMNRWHFDNCKNYS